MDRYSWPGNIREMVATISRTALSSRDHVIQADDVQFLRPENGNGHGLSREHKGVTLHEVERDHIAKTLEALSWNKRSAARLLEISRERLHRKIMAYKLTPPDTPTRGGNLE